MSIEYFVLNNIGVWSKWVAPKQYTKNSLKDFFLYLNYKLYVLSFVKKVLYYWESIFLTRIKSRISCASIISSYNFIRIYTILIGLYNIYKTFFDASLTIIILAVTCATGRGGRHPWRAAAVVRTRVLYSCITYKQRGPVWRITRQKSRSIRAVDGTRRGDDGATRWGRDEAQYKKAPPVPV